MSSNLRCAVADHSDHMPSRREANKRVRLCEVMELFPLARNIVKKAETVEPDFSLEILPNNSETVTTSSLSSQIFTHRNKEKRNITRNISQRDKHVTREIDNSLACINEENCIRQARTFTNPTHITSKRKDKLVLDNHISNAKQMFCFTVPLLATSVHRTHNTHSNAYHYRSSKDNTLISSKILENEKAANLNMNKHHIKHNEVMKMRPPNIRLREADSMIVTANNEKLHSEQRSLQQNLGEQRNVVLLEQNHERTNTSCVPVCRNANVTLREQSIAIADVPVSQTKSNYTADVNEYVCVPSEELVESRIDCAVNNFAKRATAMSNFLQTVTNQMNNKLNSRMRANEYLSSCESKAANYETSSSVLSNEPLSIPDVPPTEQRFDLIRVNRLTAMKKYNRGLFASWSESHTPLQVWVTRSGRLVIGARHAHSIIENVTSRAEATAAKQIQVANIKPHNSLSYSESNESIPSSLEYYERLIQRTVYDYHHHHSNNDNNNNNNIAKQCESKNYRSAAASATSNVLENNSDIKTTTTATTALTSSSSLSKREWVFPSTQTFRCFDDDNGLLSFTWLNVAGTLHPGSLQETTSLPTTFPLTQSECQVYNSSELDEHDVASSNATSTRYKLESMLSSEDKEFIATLVSAMCKRYRAKLTTAELTEAKRLLRLRRQQDKLKSEHERGVRVSSKNKTPFARSNNVNKPINSMQETELPINTRTTEKSATDEAHLILQALSPLSSTLAPSSQLSSPLLQISKEGHVVRPLTASHPHRTSWDHTLTAVEAARLQKHHLFNTPEARLSTSSQPEMVELSYPGHSLNFLYGNDNESDAGDIEANSNNTNASKSNIFSYTLPGTALQSEQLTAADDRLHLTSNNDDSDKNNYPLQGNEEEADGLVIQKSSSKSNNDNKKKKEELDEWLGALANRQRDYNISTLEPLKDDLLLTNKPTTRRTTKTFSDAPLPLNVSDKMPVLEDTNLKEQEQQQHNKWDSGNDKRLNSASLSLEESESSMSVSDTYKKRNVNVDSVERQHNKTRKHEESKATISTCAKDKVNNRTNAVLHSINLYERDTTSENNVDKESHLELASFATDTATEGKRATHKNENFKDNERDTKEYANQNESSNASTNQKIKPVLDDFADALLDNNNNSTFYGKTLGMPGFLSASGLYFPSNNNDDDNNAYDEVMRARRAVLEEWNESNAQELSKQATENINTGIGINETSVVGFTVTEEELVAKFRAEAEEFYSDLTNKRNSLQNDALASTLLIEEMKQDVERLSSGIADVMTAEEFAMQLTREVNEYAKTHNLHWTTLNFSSNSNNNNNNNNNNNAEIDSCNHTDAIVNNTHEHNNISNSNGDHNSEREQNETNGNIAQLQKRKSLQPEDMDANYLRQLFEGTSITTRDITCQVNDADLGYIDSTRRVTESSMEDMFTHETRLMQSVKLATIAIANIMSFHASLELEATCKYCFCIFDNPRTLWPCGHTFCAHCLPEMYNDEDELICAECHSICEVGYTPNLSLEMMANYQVIQESNECTDSNASSVTSYEEHNAHLPTTSTTGTGRKNEVNNSNVVVSNSSNASASSNNRYIAKNVLYQNITHPNAQKMTVERVLRHLLNDLLSIQSKLYADT